MLTPLPLEWSDLYDFIVAHDLPQAETVATIMSRASVAHGTVKVDLATREWVYFSREGDSQTIEESREAIGWLERRAVTNTTAKPPSSPSIALARPVKATDAKSKRTAVETDAERELTAAGWTRSKRQNYWRDPNSEDDYPEWRALQVARRDAREERGAA